MQASGEARRENEDVCLLSCLKFESDLTPSLRGAPATKQSIVPLRCLMDCFAEPVIGRAFARPVGSQ